MEESTGYLLTLYVTLTQENAIRELFQHNDWKYCKLPAGISAPSSGTYLTLKPYLMEENNTKTVRYQLSISGGNDEPKLNPLPDLDLTGEVAENPVINSQAQKVQDCTKSFRNDKDDQVNTIQDCAESSNRDQESQDGVELRIKNQSTLTNANKIVIDVGKERRDKTVSPKGMVSLLKFNKSWKKTLPKSAIYVNSESRKFSGLGPHQQRGKEVQSELSPNCSLLPDSIKEEMPDNFTGEDHRSFGLVITEMTEDCAKGDEVIVKVENSSSFTEEHPNQEGASSSQSNVKINMKCKICQEEFHTLKTCQDHMVSHAPEKFYICPICGNAYQSATDLENHKKLSHKSKTFACSNIFCNKSFDSKKSLSRHMTMHKGIGKYDCDQCGKSFALLRYLKDHQKQLHGTKSHMCNLCGKLFAKLSTLEAHRITHSEEKQFTCPICLKTFASRNYLKDHEIRHVADKVYICEICGKSFRFYSTFYKHKAVHANKKIYKCDECDKTFNRADVLDVHKRRHTQERSYVCEGCGKRFVTSTELYKHKVIGEGRRCKGLN